jgi:hypothetical protein
VKLSLDKLDQPLIFAFAIIMVVVGGMALLSWLFCKLKWTGPLGLVKGGVV